MPIGRGIDNVLETLKWPIGVLAVLMVVPLVYAAIQFVGRLVLHPVSNLWGLIWFVAGILLYTFVWRPFGQKRFETDWLLTVEHELTHALFAFLTWHRVKSFKVTREGGKVEVVGGSNWLIALAPYFFPTAPLILMLVSVLMPLASVLPWTRVLLGFAMAYHVRSTVTETHGAQTDFEQAGKWFSAMFLPAANLLAVGMVATFAVGGWEEVTQFLGDTSSAIEWFINLFFASDSIEEDASATVTLRDLGLSSIRS